MSEIAQAAAAALRAAKTGEKIADLPAGAAISTAEDAYRAQDLVIGEDGVAGWKIAANAAPEKRSCAALAAPSLIPDGAGLPLGGDRTEVEVEVAIRIAADLPPGRIHARDEVLAALGGAHAALEILGSRFIDRKAVPVLSTLADAQSNLAFVIGEGRDGWQALELGSLGMVLRSGEAELGRAEAGPTTEQTIEALVWLANHAAARGRGLRAGQFVITGARIGPLPLASPIGLAAEVAELGRVALRLE